jgi:hypothetical protein
MHSSRNKQPPHWNGRGKLLLVLFIIIDVLIILYWIVKGEME